METVILIETPTGVQIPILGGASPKKGAVFICRGCILLQRGSNLFKKIQIVVIGVERICLRLIITTQTAILS